MKKIFKALAAVTFITLFMSCNLTINSSDSSSISLNNVVITNGTAYSMDKAFVVPSGSYDPYMSNAFYESTYGDDLDGTLVTYGTVTIDLDDYTGTSFYVVFIDVDGDRWALYVSTSYSTANISNASFSEQ